MPDAGTGTGQDGMSKAARIREQTAREKVAAQRAAARRAETRRRFLVAGGSILAVVAIVVTLILVKAAGNSASPAKPSTAAKSLPAVTSELTSVPASTLNAAGRGKVAALIPVRNAPPLTANGKPEMLYVGGEYCPYCAAERWAMAVALSRFGTLSGLHYIHSSGTDVYPDTPTLTFYKSSYSSRYLTFTPVEWYSGTPQGSGYAVLQQPTRTQFAIFNKYDAPPYISASGKGSFPFVDFGNKYLIIGAQYLPTALHGLTWAQVAAAIRDPSSAVARDVNAAANTITAAICKMTGGKPGNVCTSPAATAGSKGL
jgi:hypothetical protein